jgi:HK97 gp10 family phage protein
MSDIKIEIKGLDEFRKMLSLSPIIARKELNTAIRTSILIMLRYLKTSTLVPVRTGLLKQSIRSSFSDLKGTLAPHTNYAIFVHEGTRYQKAQPFLKETIDDKMQNIQHEFDSAASRIVKQLAK